MHRAKWQTTTDPESRTSLHAYGTCDRDNECSMGNTQERSTGDGNARQSSAPPA